jgi:hypothetical protein
MTNNNNELQMMGGMLVSASFLPDSLIRECKSFREAVRLAWRLRRIKAMTQATLAERCEIYAPHVSDYLAADDAVRSGQRTRRSLPVDKIALFEAAVGNRAITQYLVRQVDLTLMEEVLEARKAA